MSSQREPPRGSGISKLMLSSNSNQKTVPLMNAFSSLYDLSRGVDPIESTLTGRKGISMSIGQRAASASGDRHRDPRGLPAPTRGESGALEGDRRVHELDPVSPAQCSDSEFVSVRAPSSEGFAWNSLFPSALVSPSTVNGGPSITALVTVNLCSIVSTCQVARH